MKLEYFLVGLSLGLLTGVTFGVASTAYDFKSSAIDRGYAYYCPIDGYWAWKGECEK